MLLWGVLLTACDQHKPDIRLKLSVVTKFSLWLPHSSFDLFLWRFARENSLVVERGQLYVVLAPLKGQFN